MSKHTDLLQDAVKEYEELRVENIKLRHAVRSFVDAYERGNPLDLTEQEVERIKAIQEII